MKKIAVFTSTQREFDLMELEPKDLFVRVSNPDHCRGRVFYGCVKCIGWYNSDDDILEAHEAYLRRKK